MLFRSFVQQATGGYSTRLGIHARAGEVDTVCVLCQTVFCFLNILCFGFLYYSMLSILFVVFSVSNFLPETYGIIYSSVHYLLLHYTVLYTSLLYHSLFIYFLIYLHLQTKHGGECIYSIYITMSLFFFHVISINTKITNCSPTIYASHNVLH